MRNNWRSICKSVKSIAAPIVISIANARVKASTFIVLTACFSANSVLTSQANAVVDALAATEKLLPGAFFAQGDGKARAMALSFDDGPGASTEDLLKILQEEGVKATFFVNGVHVVERPELLKKIVAQGHEVGDHTYSHANFYAFAKRKGQSATEAFIAKEMSRSKEAIYKVLGSYPKLCRMPNGFSKQWVRPIAKEQGYTLVNWSFGTDWQKMSPEDMAKAYKQHLVAGGILLMHDGGTRKQKMLGFVREVIEAAKAKKLALKKVSELLEGA